MSDTYIKLIPAKYRVWIYATFALVGLALSATAAGYASIGMAQPAALQVAFAVLGVVAPAFGVTAIGNVQKDPPREG